MSRSSEPGWVRIGRWDDAKRRSLWSRITEPPNAASRRDATRVEVCAGREGDDLYFDLKKGDPGFEMLLDIATAGEWFAELDESKD